MFHPLPASMVAAEAAYRSEKVKHDFQRSQGGWFGARARRNRRAERGLEIALEQPAVQLPRQREPQATPVQLPEPVTEPASDRHHDLHSVNAA
jgi:hypothetical protein